VAYLVSIAYRCEKAGCSARASVQVFNAANAPSGRYCRRHGDAAVRDLKQREVEHWLKTQQEE